MAYEYLDHEADVGIRASGNSVEEMFEEGARALFELTATNVSNKTKVVIECQANSIETLFVEWLNEILASRDIESMFFSDCRVKEIKKQKEFHLKAEIFGEKIDLDKHKINTDVKGATYYGLDYTNDKFHTIECVLDV